VAEKISAVGGKELWASDDKPTFTPVMSRLRTASHIQKDWLASQHTSYLKKQLTDAATEGQTTNIESNTHFGPRLAVGENFAKNIETTGTF
jgi:hypothetical protein